MICLDKMKSEAWRLTALWKDKHKEAHLFKKLWKLQILVKKLRTTQILRKDSSAHPFTSLEAELREAVAENWDNPPKEQKWRLKIIPQMIKVGLSWISSLEQQLGVFLDNYPGVGAQILSFSRIIVGTCSLVINSTMFNPGGASSNPSFLIL